MSENPVIGGQLGNYLIESAIGRGGMSTVYRAAHNRLGTPVAVKVLSPELSEDDAFRERFLREAKMAAGIDHPNVIPIHDTGLSGDSLYIVMKFVAGGDLKTMLVTSGRLGLDETLAILGPVARALDAAHAHGLVHRDVKPANILLQKSAGGEVEHVYLSDFGVMKHTSSISGLTKTGAIVGTIDYMAPEQIEGTEVGPRTDVYALGCLFYHCVTGRIPHHRESDAAVMWAHIKGDFEPASSINPELPAGARPGDREGDLQGPCRAVRELRRVHPGLQGGGSRPRAERSGAVDRRPGSPRGRHRRRARGPAASAPAIVGERGDLGRRRRRDVRSGRSRRDASTPAAGGAGFQQRP